MKNTSLILLCIVFELYSFVGYSQNNSAYSIIETKNVVHYEVKEMVNMKFGGTVTSYTVSDLSLIRKNELGPNNFRIITPIYKTEKNSNKKYYIETKNLNPNIEDNHRPTNITEIKINSKNIEIPEVLKIEKESIALVIQTIIKSETPKEVKPTITAKKADYIIVSVIDTYERVAEKGYKSVYIFKELGNHYFFAGEMQKAAKWYEELFAMTNDFDPVYFYRFGDSLKKTGKTKRGEELVATFLKLSE